MSEDSAPIRIGLLRLTDSAPVIVAHELGLFADEGLDVVLSVEPSWANIADKLAYGALEAASIVPPLAIAVSLGLRGPRQNLVIPCMLSLGGNVITLAKPLADEIKAARDPGHNLLAGLAKRVRGLAQTPSFGVVHEYSTHNLLLRYCLGTYGLFAGQDFEISVTPPERTLEALTSGRIVGFCAGAPWGEIAARAGVGGKIATTYDIWRRAPEKAFALRGDWARVRIDAAHGLLRGLYRAARFCDAPQNSAYVAALLARRIYLNADPHAILSSLPGALDGEAVSVFHHHAATFPWRSHAFWMHAQMARWGLVDGAASTRDAVAAIYRPDIYRAALKPIDAPLPEADVKLEGGHGDDWEVPASPAPITMQSDLFCDGGVF